MSVNEQEHKEQDQRRQEIENQLKQNQTIQSLITDHGVKVKEVKVLRRP